MGFKFNSGVYIPESEFCRVVPIRRPSRYCVYSRMNSYLIADRVGAHLQARFAFGDALRLHSAPTPRSRCVRVFERVTCHLAELDAGIPPITLMSTPLFTPAILPLILYCQIAHGGCGEFEASPYLTRHKGK